MCLFSVRYHTPDVATGTDCVCCLPIGSVQLPVIHCDWLFVCRTGGDDAANDETTWSGNDASCYVTSWCRNATIPPSSFTGHFAAAAALSSLPFRITMQTGFNSSDKQIILPQVSIVIYLLIQFGLPKPQSPN